MNTCYYLIFFLLSASIICAQESPWSIEISQSPGKLIKHSNKMKFEPTGLAQFTELDFSYQTQGKKDWEIYYHLPRIGLSLRYLYLGQPSEILGDGFSLYPFIDFGFFQRKQSSLRFTIGCGLAYLNKTYQINHNPSQTAIGSHLNDLTTFQFKFEHTLYKTNCLSAGISLSHMSNGAYQAPNLGLNFVSAIIGYSFHFKQYSSVQSVISSAQSVISSAQSVISAAFEYGLSLIEDQIPGGPKFLIQWYTFDIGYQYSPFKSWRISLDIENNNFDIYKEKSTNGKRINMYLGHQWLFGNVGLNFRNGYEFIRNHEVNSTPIATKLDLCYIMPVELLAHVRPYFGFSLKAHLTTAEYIGVMAGLRFHKK